MKYKVEFTYQAESEANAAYRWIAKDAPAKAIEWFDGLIRAVQSLSSMPERCAVAAESGDVALEIRHLIYGNYRVLFSIEDNTVLVLHIRHSKQRYLAKQDF